MEGHVEAWVVVKKNTDVCLEHGTCGLGHAASPCPRLSLFQVSAHKFWHTKKATRVAGM